MKRLLFFLAFVIGAMAALAVLRSEVSIEDAANRIARVMLPFGDRNPDFKADATIRLFPRLAIVFSDIRIAASHDAPLAAPDFAADGIIADIDVLPLFIGQTSISRLVIDHPRLQLTTSFDLAGFVPTRALLDHLLPASIMMHRGELRIVSPDKMRVETWTNLEASLRWPRAFGNLSLDGSATWRGEKIAVSMQGIAPPRLASGETGDVDLTIDTPKSRLNFAGKATLSDRLQLDGVFSAEAEEPRQLFEFFSLNDAGALLQVSPDTLPPLQLSGHLRSQGWLVALSDAELRLGSATAVGVLSARLDLIRPQLRGTLAIGDLDLTPALNGVQSWDWFNGELEKIARPILAGLDVDLRFSVGEAAIGSTRLTNVAASLLVVEGQLLADIGDVSLFGGTGALSLRGAFDRDGIKAGGRGSLIGVNVGALRALLHLDGVPPATGTISMAGEFATTGDDLASAVVGLHGTATCDAPLLALSGLSAPALLFASAQAPLLQAANLQLSLNSEIKKATCALSFVGADITVRRLDFSMGGLQFNFSGWGSLATRMFRLAGDAWPESLPAQSTGAAQSATDQAAPSGLSYVPIHIDGSLDHLIATYDTERKGLPPDPGLPTGAIPQPAAKPD